MNGYGRVLSVALSAQVEALQPGTIGPWGYLTAPLEVIGWVGMTLGPIGIAVGSWWVAKHIRYGWVMHLLFPPILFIADAMFMHLTPPSLWDDTGDGSPGMGIFFLPYAIILLGSLIVYYVVAIISLIANLVRKIVSIRRRA